MRNVALVNPPRYKGTPVIRHFRSNYLYNYVIPPMDLAYFAGVAKDMDWEKRVELIDANGENLREEETLKRLESFQPDLIIVNAAYNIIEHELEVARRYKKTHPDVKIILSSRTSLGSEEYLFDEFEFLDGIARGEIDAFAKDIIQDLELDLIEGIATRKNKHPKIRVVKDLDEHPIPDIDALPDLWYEEYSVPNYYAEGGYFLTGARGCPYGCTFCPVGGYDGQPFYYRERSVENIIEELELLKQKGIDDFFFFNEIFTFPGFANELCQRMKKEKLEMSWVCEGKSNHIQEKMLNLMNDAGCKAVFYGVESGDDKLIEATRKGQNSEHVRKAFRMTKDAGMKAGAYIILGFPDESWKTFFRTFKLLREIRPDTIKLALLAPYQGTEMYKDMASRGLITDIAGESYDRNLTSFRNTETRTRHLTNLELKIMDNIFRVIFYKKVF